MKDQVDYKKKSQEIFKLINDYRKNPKSLSKYLESLKKYVNKDKVLCEPNKISIQMVEGVDVINEAIKFLNSLSSLPPFEWEPLLAQSAQFHVDDIGPKGELLYQSTDGTDPADRIGMFGTYVDSLGENIDFGPNDALGVIVSLTLDDGEDERPHRENLFNTSYRKIGIACGYHKTEFQMCVMDFAYDFLPLEDKKKYSQENEVSQSHDNEVVSKHYGNNDYSYQNNDSNVRNSIQKNQTQSQNVTGKKVESQGQVNMVMSNNKNLEKVESKKVESNNNSKNIKSSNTDKLEKDITTPLVKVNIDSQENFYPMKSEISKLNSTKKILSKYIEITTKTVFSYEDGSKKETIEKEDHTYNY